MEKAKKTVVDFLSMDGKHKTTVDEDLRPAVTDEHIHPHQHTEITTAIDKDIHQHHHHTVVQPLHLKETLPEKHSHKALPVEHKEFHHDDERELRVALERDAAKYKDTSVTHNTTESSAAAGPAVSGEHIHHHVHEHLQPVIHKETVATHIVHTTIPIHETHHAKVIHHGTSTLPAQSLQEFLQSTGGTIHGRDTTILRSYDGCPQGYNKELQSEQLDGDRNMHLAHATMGDASRQEGMVDLVDGDRSLGTKSTVESSGRRQGAVVSMLDGVEKSSHTKSGVVDRDSRSGISPTGASVGASGLKKGGAATTSSLEGDKRAHAKGSSSSSDGDVKHSGSLLDPKAQTGEYTHIHQPGTETLGAGVGTTDSKPRSATQGSGSNKERPYVDSLGVRSGGVRNATGETMTKRASLADKLNPFKDADGDGKKGFMH